jgi:hypothetical protein
MKQRLSGHGPAAGVNAHGSLGIAHLSIRGLGACELFHASDEITIIQFAGNLARHAQTCDKVIA